MLASFDERACLWGDFVGEGVVERNILSCVLCRFTREEGKNNKPCGAYDGLSLK